MMHIEGKYHRLNVVTISLEWINFVGELIMMELLTFGYTIWIASIS